MASIDVPTAQGFDDASDRAEFEANSGMRFLVRELRPEESACFSRPGARPLVTVFRDGTRGSYYEVPGWHALANHVTHAEWAIAKRPALAAEENPIVPPYTIGVVSPLVSGFVYLDVPGTISFLHDGARVYRGFDPDVIGHGWRLWLGLYQQRMDRERRYSAHSRNYYDGPLIFPHRLICSSSTPSRLRLRYAPVPTLHVDGAAIVERHRGWRLDARGSWVPAYEPGGAIFRPRI